MLFLDWVDEDLEVAKDTLSSTELDEFEKELVEIRILRRESRHDTALQKCYVLRNDLDPDEDREMYQVLLSELQSILFEQGLLLEVDEITDTIVTHVFNYPFEDNEFILGSRFLMQGILFSKRGDQQMSINQFLHAISWFELMSGDNKLRLIGLCHNNVGYCYTLLGLINESIQHYKISADITQDINIYDAARTNANLGLAYYYISQNEKAIEYLNLSLDQLSPDDNLIEVSLPLFNLVYIHAEQGNLEYANDYLEQLRELNVGSNSMVLESRTKMANGILNFYKKTFQGQFLALEIFSELVENRFLLPFYLKLAYAFIAEIILNEALTFGDQTKLDEVSEILSELDTLGSKEKSSVLMINSKLLRIQINLIKGNIEIAESIRDEIQDIVEQSGINITYRKLNAYFNYVFQSSDLYEQNLPQQIAGLNTHDTLRNLRQDLISINIQSEVPIMFLLISDAGLVQDRIVFSESFEANEHLIASFLQAINIFFQDTLADNNAIEQINSKEYSIFLRRYDRFTMTYIARGVAPNVNKKMTRIELRLNELNVLKNDWISQNNNLQKITFTEDVENVIREEIYRDIQ